MAMVEQNLALAEYNYVPQLAISPQQAAKAYQELREVAKSVLIEGTDYGVIPGTPKPSLYKSGAENLLRFFGLGHTIERTSAVEDWENGFFTYTYKVTVHKTMPNGTRLILSECEGSANSREPKYYKKKNGDLRDPYEQVNTLQKMAIKRGLVGASLQATGASGLFTQDIEDMDNFKQELREQGNNNRGNGNRSGGSNNGGGNRATGAKPQVLNKMKEMGLSWDQLAEVASAALNRLVKKVMTEIGDNEWQTVLDHINAMNSGGTGGDEFGGDHIV